MNHIFKVIIIIMLFSFVSCSKHKINLSDFGITKISSDKKVYLFQSKHEFEKFYGPVDDYLWKEYSDYNDLNILLNRKNEIIFISVGKNGLNDFKVTGTDKPISELTIYELETTMISDNFVPGNRVEQDKNISIFQNFYGYMTSQKYTKEHMPKNFFGEHIQLREFYFDKNELYYFRMAPWISLVE